MPIEIRELIIRARIDPDDNRSVASRSASIASGHQQEEIIRACVQEVLQILEDKRER